MIGVMMTMMGPVATFFRAGGWVSLGLLLLAVVLTILLVERFLAVNTQLACLQEGGLTPHGLACHALDLPGARRMGLIRACIVIAPLLGLLGTVTGMIDTFTQMMVSGQPAEMSDGIRKALLTTQYGLVVAAPALVAEHVLLQRLRQLQRLAWQRHILLAPDSVEHHDTTIPASVQVAL